MRKYLLLLFLLGTILHSNLSAQERKCAANEVMERQISKNPGLATKMLAIEKHTQEFIAAKRSNLNKGKPPGTPGGGNGGGGGEDPAPPPIETVNIPVIVHVVYKTTAQNILTDRINEQIKTLNDDFAAKNGDLKNYIPFQYSNVVSQGAGISFTLSQVIRKETTVTSFSTNDAMKFASSGGSNVVDPSQYLNIWVCNMSGGILGYAQFPGGNPETDGVVVLYSAFGNSGGNYGLGRTATHEVGHYFNLRHIWGDRRCGSDLVDDTPLHDAANYGCPAIDATSNCKGPVVEMWMNYMDYSYDACMYMFSLGQASRMQATLAEGGPRFAMTQKRATTNIPAIVNAISMNEEVQLVSASFKIYPTLTKGNINIQFTSTKSNVAELAIFNSAGIMVSKKAFAATAGYNTRSFDLKNLANGLYIARLIENGETKTGKLVVQH